MSEPKQTAKHESILVVDDEFEIGLPPALCPARAESRRGTALMRPLIAPAALALGALLMLAAPAAAAPAAPAFTITLLDGTGHFDSRAHIGKHVLVVRFQASWCKVCNQEAAGIERIYKKYRARGVELVSVQVQDTEADARRFLRANNATYPAGLDPRLKIANRFGFRGTPYTVIINKRGEMVARIHGRADEARLSGILDPLVKPARARKTPARSK